MISVSPLRRVGICSSRLPIIGKRFPSRKLLTVVCNASSDGPISSPSVRLARRFVAAAFIAANEPLKVVLASSAATPAIPKSS